MKLSKRFIKQSAPKCKLILMSTADIYIFVFELSNFDPLISKHCSCFSSWEEFEREIYLFVHSLPLPVKVLR